MHAVSHELVGQNMRGFVWMPISIQLELYLYLQL
jgi:hypothetical protein